MRYELFAFDLDGTLLSPDGEIPEATRAFVVEIGRKAQVTLATGRSLASAEPYIRELAITTPVILYHGAVVWDPVGGQPIRERRIPSELARRALTVLKRFPIQPQVYRTAADPAVYVARVTPPIQAFLEKEKLPVQEVQDLDEVVTTPPLKLLAIGDPSGLGEVGETLRRAVPELTVVRSEKEHLEVLPPGVSKGEALSWLCQYFGIRPEHVVAVGDQMSDLTMIELAGLGVAMAHAPEEVREKADVVVYSVLDLCTVLGTPGATSW